jgi:hypothetical protein
LGGVVVFEREVEDYDKSPSGSFQGKEREFLLRENICMGRAAERVGSAISRTLPVVSVLMRKLQT